MVLRSLAIILFVVGFIVALFDFASDGFTFADPIWIAAVLVAAAGATVGVLLRKRGSDATVANVVWRVAPLAGVAVGIFYICVFFWPQPASAESSYFGITVLAYAAIGLVWGCLCAGGAVIGSKIVGRLSAVAIGSVFGAIIAGILTAPLVNGAPMCFALGGIVTAAICAAVPLAYRGTTPLRYP